MAREPHPLVQQLAVERRRAELTQQQVADRLGYSSAAIACWERGHRMPPLPALEAYAGLFGKTVQFAEAVSA